MNAVPNRPRFTKGRPKARVPACIEVADPEAELKPESSGDAVVTWTHGG